MRMSHYACHYACSFIMHVTLCMLIIMHALCMFIIHVIMHADTLCMQNIMHAEHYACRYIMHVIMHACIMHACHYACMFIMHACSLCMHVHYACMFIMQVLASQLHFLANRKAELYWGTTCCTAVSRYCLFPLKFSPISTQSCVFLPNQYIKAIRAVKLLQYRVGKKLIQISREFHYGLFPWVYREQIVT